MFSRIKRRLDDAVFLRRHSADVNVSLRTKLRMWLNGFVSEAWPCHSFDRNDLGEYVNDVVRLKKACRFNGYYAIMLLDKLYFTKMLGGFGENLPSIFGLLRGGRFHLFDSPQTAPAGAVLDLCGREGALVIKPIVGTRGEGVHIFRREADAWMLNGRAVASSELSMRLSGLEDYLVTEFVRQHEYARRIYASSTNTIRILTLWDEEDPSPFAAAAVHRFGTIDSSPMDNWTLGGLSAKVDLETGRLGKAVSYPKGGKVRSFEKHPETCSRIEQIQVPHWEAIRTGIIEMARALPFAPYIGWDIVVTAEGFKVIEGNNTPGINLMQIHEPLLRNPRVRKFYEKRLCMLEEIDKEGEVYKLPFKI